MKTSLRSSFFALELALGVFFRSFSCFLVLSGDFSFFPSGGDREIGTMTFFASFFWRCKLDDLFVNDFGWLVSTLDRTFRKADWLRGFWAWFGFGLAQNWRSKHVNNERSLIRSRSFSIPIDSFYKSSESVTHWDSVWRCGTYLTKRWLNKNTLSTKGERVVGPFVGLA